MWTPSSPSTIYWRYYAFNTVYYCCLCQRLVDHTFIDLFLCFLLYLSVCLFLWQCRINLCTTAL
jgi:hypothetical protein